MDLILWRHAEAEEGDEDLQRKLTNKGQQQAKITATWLRERLPEHTRVWVSQAKRSQQTAAHLKLPVSVVPMLNPTTRSHDLPGLLQRENNESALVWVGHQPWLGQMCAFLLNQQWDNTLYWSVKKSGFWWFEIKVDSHRRIEAKLKAALTPNMVKKDK
ncbi:histidine phosphatase family protein [Snodgrassella sp. CFCC 13594]|uniref:SixA phosphatase family protein n=1 Tax=Snodgrassella sp. CFCC 13594 TaxID=1775559 RepID=UPI000832BEA8|nr:histidine phosphatase family protein [Snodgrassella sp. CFCC 13594]